jgi:nitrogen fixation/metabolism regulation signal transduction histidine kinase
MQLTRGKSGEHWSDSRELPGIYPFLMQNWLDCFDRIVPKSQKVLTAIHGKVADLSRECTARKDQEFLEKMYDTFQSMVAELRHRFEKLKHGLEETATREEISRIIEHLFSSMNIETETSVERVKCIVCGRETNKVAGAIIETHISRALGTLPNSIAFHTRPAAAPIGVAYQSRDGFNGEMMESSQAVRPFRRT